MYRTALWYSVSAQTPPLFSPLLAFPRSLLLSLSFSSETSLCLLSVLLGGILILSVCEVHAVIPLREADSVPCLMSINSAPETSVCILLDGSDFYFTYIAVAVLTSSTM